MIYKLYKTSIEKTEADAAYTVNEDGSMTSFIFDPDNTDYANFKKEILADEAQLQDSEGNVTADAKDYVRTLP
jgi:hypothetical protein